MTLRRSSPCSRLQSKRWPLPPWPLSSRYLSTWWSVRAGKVSPTLSAFSRCGRCPRGLHAARRYRPVFITMQLHGGQPQSLRGRPHRLQRRIAEDADVLQRRSGDHRLGLGVIHRNAARSGRRSAHCKRRRTPRPPGHLRARQAAHFVLAEQHAFNRRFQIRLLHQGRSRSGSCWRSGSARALRQVWMPDSLITVTSAETRRQLTGAVKVNRQIAQVAVVNANHLRLFGGDGAPSSSSLLTRWSARPYSGCEPRRELTILFIVEHREHQQAGVGLIVARQ